VDSGDWRVGSREWRDESKEMKVEREERLNPLRVTKFPMRGLNQLNPEQQRVPARVFTERKEFHVIIKF